MTKNQMQNNKLINFEFNFNQKRELRPASFLFSNLDVTLPQAAKSQEISKDIFSSTRNQAPQA
jgi:hypothetical protein